MLYNLEHHGSMATVLSSLGVTSPVPDPAAYKNVMDEVTNMVNVRNMTQSTIDRINAALDTAVATRLPRTYIDKLEEIANETTNLQTANLGAAASAAKLGDIENRLANIIKEQEGAIQKQRTSELKSLQHRIEKRLKRVENTNLKKEYEKLLHDVKGAFLQGTSIEVLHERLAELDEKDENDTNKEFNWARFRGRILRIMMRGLLIISVSFGALFGGIILSNAFAEDYFWGIKLFYFIYGAAFFPLSLFYGIYYKPHWVSGLIPLYSIDLRIVPTVATAPSAIKSVVDKTAATSDVVNMLTSVQKDSNTLLKGVAGISSIQTDAAKVLTAVQTDAAKALTGTANALTAVQMDAAKALTVPPQKGGAGLTLSQQLFGYKIVNLTAVTPEQKKSQDTLHRISIVEIVLLSIVSLYYGVSKILGKRALTFGASVK